MEFKHTQLPNGLIIIAETNPEAACLAAGFFVRTGSRDETQEVSGVSHFLEHMVFKGTERRNAFQVSREFDDLGAEYNAMTSYENTVYFGAVLPEFQTQLLDVLCDIMRPALRDDDFDVEKNVILEEIALYEDQPKFRTFDKLMSAFFAGHPLGNRILGTKESISALTAKDMRSYFDRRYSPGNVIAVGVGKLDYGALVDKVAQMCGDWQPAEAPRETPPAPRATTRQTITDKKLTREHIGLMSPAPACQDAERYAAQVLATLLGDSSGSRLFYALIEPAIAHEALTVYDPLDGAGGFITFISADPERAEEALGIAVAEFEKFMDEGPTERELGAAKNKIASGATLRGELPMGRLGAVGVDWVYRREYIPLAEQIETMLAVTREEVTNLAGRYDLSAVATLALGPREKL
ncbi:MAG: M16 family metallopeptidase [Planctomycetota bacterium]|jgi:predicted Zn-dependent peptidase